MSYRKGYYKKDGTYVQGHFVNKKTKSIKVKKSNSFGCLVTILIGITTVIFSCTEVEDSNCSKKKCADFSSQNEAQDVFNSDSYCHSNLDRDNDGIACENGSY